VSRDNSLESVSLVSFLRVNNGFEEESLVPLKRELVHGVDDVHIEQDEVKSRGLLSYRSVVLTRVVNLLHGDLKSFLSVFSFLRLFFSGVKGVDKVNIFKERSLLVLEGSKNFILKLLEHVSVISNLLNVIVLSLLNLRSFLLYDNTEALFFKSGLCYREINYGGTSNNSGFENRVGDSSGNIELELGVPVNFTVSNHNLSLLANSDVVFGNDVV